MKTHLVVVAGLLLASSTAFAESRSILVWLDRSQTEGISATIYSDEKSENKQKIKLGEAALILKGAKAWGSMVSVFILSESNIETRDYLVLLEGMKENGFLQLRSIEVSHDRSFSGMAGHLLKQFTMEPQSKP